MENDLITEDWLKAVGFKWHEIERSPNKHWLLWLGDCMDKITSYEDIGVEVTYTDHSSQFNGPAWCCFLRGDGSHRYHRFIHVRTLRTQNELIRLIEGLTGQDWNPANNYLGCMRTSEQMARIRKDDERLDKQILRTSAKWYEAEKDDSRAGALTDDLNYAIEHRAKG